MEIEENATIRVGVEEIVVWYESVNSICTTKQLIRECH